MNELKRSFIFGNTLNQYDRLEIDNIKNFNFVSKNIQNIWGKISEMYYSDVRTLHANNFHFAKTKLSFITTFRQFSRIQRVIKCTLYLILHRSQFRPNQIIDKKSVSHAITIDRPRASFISNEVVQCL